MVRGKAISEDLGWTIVHMRYMRSLDVETIGKLTSLSPRAIHNVLDRHRQSGHVKYSERKARERESTLSNGEIQVCLVFVKTGSIVTNGSRDRRG